MKGLGPILAWLAISALAATPFAIFRGNTKIGKFLRLCAGLACLLFAYLFLSQLESQRKSPSPLWFMVGIPYFYAFLAQIFRRKGLPLVESAFGLCAFAVTQAATANFALSALMAILAVWLVYLVTARLAPITTAD
jgi:hypothetical protein